MDVLHPAERAYAWGSRVALPKLAGEPTPSPFPVAERWFGAHPTGPARIGETGLDVVIAGDPAHALGVDLAARYHDTLPFMVKLLAADQALSLQAHPSRAHAEEGYARENHAGLALDAPDRNYRDTNHKPELIVALSEFSALAGFRPPADTVRLLDLLRVTRLGPYRELLAAQPDADGLRAVFTTFITLPRTVATELIDGVIDSFVRLLAAGAVPEEFRHVARNIVEISEQYPQDTGVLGALLLNHVHLAPGEALFLGEGKLHAYLSGTGIEIMANSDNVLRGGLTSKHIDVPELLRILDFEPLVRPVVHPVSAVPPEAEPADALVVDTYPTSAGEFSVTRLRATSACRVRCDDTGPQVLVCTAGDAGVVRAGGGVWIPAGDGAGSLDLAAGTEVFRVRVATEARNSVFANEGR